MSIWFEWNQCPFIIERPRLMSTQTHALTISSRIWEHERVHNFQSVQTNQKGKRLLLLFYFFDVFHFSILIHESEHWTRFNTLSDKWIKSKKENYYYQWWQNFRHSNVIWWIQMDRRMNERKCIESKELFYPIRVPVTPYHITSIQFSITLMCSFFSFLFFLDTDHEPEMYSKQKGTRKYHDNQAANWHRK